MHKSYGKEKNTLVSSTSLRYSAELNVNWGYLHKDIWSRLVPRKTLPTHCKTQMISPNGVFLTLKKCGICHDFQKCFVQLIQNNETNRQTDFRVIFGTQYIIGLDKATCTFCYIPIDKHPNHIISAAKQIQIKSCTNSTDKLRDSL